VRTNVYTRGSSERWLLSKYSGSDAEVPLSSIDCRLALRGIYDRVDFAEAFQLI
jgi:hypothetical protein